MGRFYIQLVRCASVLGAGLSFLFGYDIVPRLMALAIWGVRHIPWSKTPPGSFPNPITLGFHPNINLGIVWLAYYIIAYIWTICWILRSRYRTIYQSTLRKPRLSEGRPGEQKWELVEHCYQRYREALARYSPQPIQLKTPPGFNYRKGNKLEWKGIMPVLPEELLTPERIHLLLPLLAHHLAYYHSFDKRLQIEWECSQDHSSWWLVMTGNFLWLSVLVKRLARWKQWKARRVHDADTFAHYLGEGKSLEHQLRHWHTELEQSGRPYTNIPSLIERIEHLEALRKEEHRQLCELGFLPGESPFVADNIQLNRVNEVGRS